MDFRNVFFHEDEKAMIKFVIENWNNIFNIHYLSEPDVGEIKGWFVNLCKPDPIVKHPNSMSDILKR